jgi:hypothetical protein
MVEEDAMSHTIRVPLLAVAFVAACGDDMDRRAVDSGPGSGADAAPDDPDAAPDDPDAAPSPDAGPAGLREQAGGGPVAVELAGDLTYVGLGPRLTIWRIADGDAELVGESGPLPGVVTGLAVTGDRAFVAERVDLAGRVHVFDVSDPARPVETASIALAEEGTPSKPFGLAVLGDRLFAADGERGVVEVDIADPDAPSPLRVVGQPATDVEVVGRRLYYTGQSFIGGGVVGALDLDGDLVELGQLQIFASAGLAVGGRDLVVAAGPGGIQVHDMSDPTTPVERFTSTLPEGGPFSRAVAIAGDTAWIPAEDGLYVLDLSEPTAISASGPFDLGVLGTNAASAVAGALAVATDRGKVFAFDAPAAGQPALRASADVSLCADCIGMTVAGDLLVAADLLGGVRTGRLDDLALLGHSVEPAGFTVFEDVAVADGLAYVADWSYGLRIYDLSDPGTPALIGQLDTAGFPSSVVIIGDRVYLGESTNGGNLRIIDVSAPENPFQLGSIPTSQARDVEVRGDLAFVADGSLNGPGGLRIFKVSDPGSIELVGYYGGDCTEALDVALIDDLAIVACAGTGFHIVDILDPTAPALLAAVPAPGLASAWSVVAWEGGAALGHDFGVLQIDIENPRLPIVVDQHATAWTVRSLAAPGGGRLVASCGLGGIYQWMMPPR